MRKKDAKLDDKCHALKINIRCLKCAKIDAKKDEKIGTNLFKSPLAIEKSVYAKKKSNFQIKDTDHIQIPRILTKQKI